MKRYLLTAVVAGLGVAGLVIGAAQATGDSTAPVDEQAVQRTRREVRMLDDLYKTAVVLINKTYVNDVDDVPAGTAARLLFGAMREKGWHDARLVDATGDPLNDDNKPKDAFERDAIKKILGGETYVDEVVTEKDKHYLRAATVVPVVDKKCTMCHPGYKVGDVLGAIAYKLEIQ
jgi:hypothetical protein